MENLLSLKRQFNFDGWRLVLSDDCPPAMNFPSHFYRASTGFFKFCRYACAVLVFSLPLSSAQAAPTRSGQVTHVMLFWLNRPGNIDDQNYLLRATRTLRRVRGVNEVRVGRPLTVNRPALEQSFDLAVVMTFRDREALEKFERDQSRQQGIDAMLRPLVRRYIVYNFVNE